MNYNLDIQRLLLQANNFKKYEDKIALLEQAILLADSNNDIDWGFDIRLQLIAAEQCISRTKKSIIAFSWILDIYESYPEISSPFEIIQEYKWLANVIVGNLDITRVQIENIFDDFRIRCINAGFSLREYHNILSNYNLFIGNDSKAREHLNLRELEDSDDLTSWGNDQIITIYVEMLENEFDRAILHINEFVAKESSHQISPIAVYSGLIYYLGYKIKDNRVEYFFEKVDNLFSEMSPSPLQIYDVSLLLYYMSFHKQEKAWFYFEKYVNIEPNVDDAIRFDFAMSVLPLFKTNAVYKLDSINNKQPFYRDDGIYKSIDLYNYYLSVATDLARKFDLRNENKHFSDQLKFMLNKLNK